MAKHKKEKKPRPDKYAEKVVINATFEEAIQVLADHANRMVADHINEAKIEEPPVGE
jgi:hypothetical protein